MLVFLENFQQFGNILDVGASNLTNPFANSTYDAGQLTSAFFAGLFSYDGWDVLNFGAEELENPARLLFSNGQIVVAKS